MKCEYCDADELYYTKSLESGVCRECREWIIPKHIPYTQQVKYLKLREEKKNGYNEIS